MEEMCVPTGSRRLRDFQPVAAKRREPEAREREVKYGNDWYEATRERPRTVKEEIGEPFTTSYIGAARTRCKGGKEKQLFALCWRLRASAELC